MGTPSPEEAVERAQRVLDSRITTIRQAVEARQHVADVRAATDRQRAELEAQIKQQVNEAKHAEVKAYNAALKAGWTADELHKIGLPEPEKKARARRRASRKPVQAQTIPPAPQQVTQDDAESAWGEGFGG